MTGDILEAIDNAIDDWSVSHDAMRWTPETPEEPVRHEWAILPEPVHTEVPWPPDLIVGIGVQMAEFGAGIRAAMAALDAMGEALGKALNAAAGPKPLPIDGHEYARRRRRR